MEHLQETITAEKNLEQMLECRHDVFEVLKVSSYKVPIQSIDVTPSPPISQENNEMRLEEEYRRRLHEVTREVKKRLDYQVRVWLRAYGCVLSQQYRPATEVHTQINIHTHIRWRWSR